MTYSIRIENKETGRLENALAIVVGFGEPELILDDGKKGEWREWRVISAAVQAER